VVLFALLLPVFFGLGAVVMDIGNWYVHKRHLQTQVDAAALAGAHEFFGCNPIYENPPVTANKAIRAHALEYAGDVLRPPSSIDPLDTQPVRNTQVEEPGDVRVVLNSATWWAQGDPTNGSTHDNTLDPDGNPVTPGDPCTTDTLDVKATDDQVTNLWGLIPLHPSPKVKA
jgi:Putative Flp pilus-assembly TadE/G-like